MHQARAQYVRDPVTLSWPQGSQRNPSPPANVNVFSSADRVAICPLLAVGLVADPGPGGAVWRPPNTVALSKGHGGVSFISPSLLVFSVSVFLLVFDLKQSRNSIPRIAGSGHSDVLGKSWN